MEKDFLQEFELWKNGEFGELKSFVSGLPCEAAAKRIEDLNEKADVQRNELSDVDLKVDAVIGSQYEADKSKARQEGILFVLVPLIIAMLIVLIRNGLH